MRKVEKEEYHGRLIMHATQSKVELRSTILLMHELMFQAGVYSLGQ